MYTSLLVALACTLLLLSLTLTRITRLFLGGRLCIKSVGLEGIQGLEWKSNGFSEPELVPRDQSRENHAKATEKEKVKVGTGGMELKIKRIHVILRFRTSPTKKTVETIESSNQSHQISKSWMTIRIEGIGLTLPPSIDKDSIEKKRKRARQMEDAATLKPHHLSQEDIRKISTSFTFNRKIFSPLLRTIVLGLLRMIVYLVVCALTLFASIIDVQMTHLEVYSGEAEVVIRVERVNIGLDVSLINQARKDKRVSIGAKISTSWAETLSVMQNWVRRVAEGAISDSLPAIRINPRIDISGLQVIEATQARQSSARVLSMPETSRFGLILVMSGFSRIPSKASVQIHVKLSPASLNLNALAKVLKALEASNAVRRGSKDTRSQLSKQDQQRKPQAMAIIMERLHSASITCPAISMVIEKKSPKFVLLPAHKQSLLGSSVQMVAEIKGIYLSIQTSIPAKIRIVDDGASCSNDFASQWILRERNEHCGAFYVEGKLSGINIRAGIDEEASEMQSEVLDIGSIEIHIRSTWTPLGLQSSGKDRNAFAQKYCEVDTKEQAVTLEVTLDRLVGDLQARHATALLAFIQSYQAQRRSRIEGLGSQKESPDTPRGHLVCLPKISIAFTFTNMSYRLHLDINPASSTEQSPHMPDLSLLITIPNIGFVSHASYADRYIKKDVRMRNAAHDPLQTDTSEPHVLRKAGPGTAVVNQSETLAHTSTKGLEDEKVCHTYYFFETNCTVSLVEVYWAVDTKGEPTRRKKFEAMRALTAEARILRSHTNLHVLGLSCFEASSNGHLPVIHDSVSNTVRLDTSQLAQDLQVSLEDVDIDLWHPAAVDATRELFGLFAWSKQLPVGNLSPKDGRKGNRAARPSIDLIDYLQAGTSACISITYLRAHVGSMDERCDEKVSRGVTLELSMAVVELACSDTRSKAQMGLYRLDVEARTTLGLPEDLISSCDRLAARHEKAAMVRLSFVELGILAILDGEQACKDHLDRTSSGPKDNCHSIRSGKSKYAHQHLQDQPKYILWMPSFSTKMELIPKNDHLIKADREVEDLSITTEGIYLLTLKIELLQSYCILMAFASLRSLIPAKGVKDEAVDDGKKARKASRFKRISYSTVMENDKINVSIALPDGVNIFCSIQGVKYTKKGASGAQVSFEALMAAVQSRKFETNGGLWEEAVRMHYARISIEPKVDSVPIKVHFDATHILIKVPFDYKIHPLIDGTIVSLKATKQLLHQFIKGGTNLIITPMPEEPKHLPIINVKIGVLVFSVEDDPFETRLTIIWRGGRDENQARIERDAAFKKKTRLIYTASALKRKAQANTSDTDTENIKTKVQSRTEQRSEVMVVIESAREALNAFNASSWIQRFKSARIEQERREEASLKSIYVCLPFDQCQDLPINLAPSSRLAPLFRSTWRDFEMQVGPTSFPNSQLRQFLYDQGKGMPMDMEYSLMVPMHLRMSCSEWIIHLRDYPLPLFHIPPCDADLHSSRSSLVAFELECDLCIAEQMSDCTAMRHIPAIIVPAVIGNVVLPVPRMVMPTKIFGSPVIKINPTHATRLVWGQSISPALSDVLRVIEGITSPPHDPSPKIGFWDKLSLILHGRVHCIFPNDGELHIYLKGSRDPYHVVGHGAGWVNCWRGNVELKIGFENEQREFFQILSNEYLMAIPDLKNYIDRAAAGSRERSSQSQRQGSHDSTSSSLPELNHKAYKRRPEFTKVCLRLTNGVRWGVGLILERTCTDDICIQEPKCKSSIPFNRECRFWTRKKHWQVYSRSKDYADTLALCQFGDSYKDWRSHHLHFSLSVYSIENDLQNDTGKRNENSNNNLYLSPLALEHFWTWMGLFNSAMGLPIRQGKLFSGLLEQSPKFGRQLATIKYHFDISPLYITHVYIQDARSDWARNMTTLLGVKARMNVFRIDLHQRQQEMIKFRPELGEITRVFHKPFYEAEIDLGDIDLRTLAAQFTGTGQQLPNARNREEEDIALQSDVIFGGVNETNTSEQDTDWHDLDDIVELDWTPAMDDKATLKIRLKQALTFPRLYYYRRLESEREKRTRAHQYANKYSSSAMEGKDGPQVHADVLQLGQSKFGQEDTHSCLVGKAPPVIEVQKTLTLERIQVLTKELDHKSAQSSSARSHDLKERIKALQMFINMADKLSHSSVFATGEGGETKLEEDIGKEAYEYLKRGASNISNFFKEWQEFDNRYYIHNPCIFYSNATRDVLLKYYMSSKKRQAIVHSLSAKAVRSIRDLSNSTSKHRKDGQAKEADGSPIKPALEDLPDLIQGVLEDTMQNILPTVGESTTTKKAAETEEEEEANPSFGISSNYEVRKSNVCVLLKPQIVLQSLANDKSTIILTATRSRIRNYSVNDPRAEEGGIHQRVMYRNFAAIDGLQAYHPSKSSNLGSMRPNGSIHVPLETLIDLSHKTKDYDRITTLTYAQIHFDKFNQLRLHDSNWPLTDTQDKSVDHLIHRMDLI
jgi:hypothetical protein